MNHETKTVFLWLTNEEGPYNYWSDKAQEHWDADPGDEAAYALATELEEEIKAGAPDLTGMYSDLFHAVWEEVNWVELAESFMEDVDKSKSEEEDE